MKSQKEIDEETQESLEKSDKRKEENTKDIMKYFNRIHDKLFSLNVILLGAFYFFSKGSKIDLPYISLWLPFVNFIILIFIEYHNMQTSRLDAKETRETNNNLKRETVVTLISSLAVIITAAAYIILTLNIIV